MVGVEFTTKSGDPDPATAKAVQTRCLAGDLILLTCGHTPTSSAGSRRWSSPRADRHGTGIFEKALSDSVH